VYPLVAPSFFPRSGAAWLAALTFVFHISICHSAVTPGFAPGVEVGTVDNGEITEASGIIASRQNPGVLWTHNDSGFRGSVFALGTNGAALGRWSIPDVYTGDFEDISFGPGPLPQFQYVYLGDIGDNLLTRESIRVFRFPEPAAYAFQSNAPVATTIFGAQEISLLYPDGPFNAEAMMVDPITGDLFIATKDTNTSRLYRATRAELDSGEAVTLKFIREIAFRSVSGGDISADGSLIAIRRPGKAGLWLRPPGTSVGDVLADNPITIPVIGQSGSPPEPNGEAIGFDPNALGYFTLSEGYAQPLYFFARTNAAPSLPRIFIGPGEDWEYNDYGVPLAPGWQTNVKDEWSPGTAPLGYGGGEQTTVWYGDDLAKNPTTYFRKSFSASGGVSNLALRLSFNDGIAVYLNGVEILRRNLGAGATFEDYATASNTNQAGYWFSIPLDPALLHDGQNLISAELHRADSDGPSLIFDLQLLEAAVDAPPRFTSRRCVNGIFQAGLAGPNGLRVRIDSSTNLGTWQTNRFVILTNGTATFSQTTTNQADYFRIQP